MQVGMGLEPVPLPCSGTVLMKVTMQDRCGMVMVHGTGQAEAN